MADSSIRPLRKEICPACGRTLYMPNRKITEHANMALVRCWTVGLDFGLAVKMKAHRDRDGFALPDPYKGKKK